LFELPFAIATPPPAATIRDNEMTSGATNRAAFLVVAVTTGVNP
jgi:hypothetical protein